MAKDSNDIRSRLARTGSPLVLDGATGTELERAGLHTGLPLWSTHALMEHPEAVRRIHSEYVRAGAEIITANTFRTQRRTLDRAGLEPDEDRRLTQLAVRLVREAVEEAATNESAPAQRIWVAGSLPPLEDCYAPDLVPKDTTLVDEHRRQIELLIESGCDLLLIETMNSAREALVAAEIAAETNCPFVVGLVSWEAGRLLSGDSLIETGDQLVGLGASAIGLNCVPPTSLEANRRSLMESGWPLLVSPNLGEPNDTTGFDRAEDQDPALFAAGLQDWLDHDQVRIIGGCCGTTPAHIRAVALALGRAVATQREPQGPSRF